MRPLVSVITPAFGPPAILQRRCIPSVDKQTYPNVEHIIVTDGPHELAEGTFGRRRVVHLGRNWHSFTPRPSWGTMARLVASGLCSGEYIAYLDQDDEFLPNHVEDLVALLEDKKADFVFSKMQVLHCGYVWPFDRVIGSAPPRWREISQVLILHRAELWHVANADPYCRWNQEHLPDEDKQYATYGSDWDLVGRLVEAGVKWAFLDKVTVNSHRDDPAELELLKNQYAVAIGRRDMRLNSELIKYAKPAKDRRA